MENGNDLELPGMWEMTDLIGGKTDTSSASPTCSLPIPEPTKLQAEKVRYLLDKGGELALPRLQVVMPDGSVASVDSHGRVYWQ